MKGKYKIMLLRGHNKAKEEEEITKKHWRVDQDINIHRLNSTLTSEVDRIEASTRISTTLR
jgi:hypothetical protein